MHLLGLEIPGTGTGCDIAWRLANVVVNICPLEATNWTIWFPASCDTGIVITCCVATPSRKNKNWNGYKITNSNVNITLLEMTTTIISYNTKNPF